MKRCDERIDQLTKNWRHDMATVGAESKDKKIECFL